MTSRILYAFRVLATLSLCIAGGATTVYADGNGALGSSYATDFPGATGILPDAVGSVTSTSASLTMATIPVSSTIPKAYIYVTQELYGATAVDTAFTVNGTAYAASVIGTESGLTAGANSIVVTRMDITAEAVATRNGSYSITGIGYSAGAREILGVSMIVVFQDSVSAHEESRVVINDGAMISCAATTDDMTTTFSGFDIDKQIDRAWLVFAGGHGEATTEEAMLMEGYPVAEEGLFQEFNGGWYDSRTAPVRPRKVDWIPSPGDTEFVVSQAGGEDCIIHAMIALSITERDAPPVCTAPETTARIDWDGNVWVPNNSTDLTVTDSFMAAQTDVDVTVSLSGGTWRSRPASGIPYVGNYPAVVSYYFDDYTNDYYGYSQAGSWGDGKMLLADATRTGSSVVTYTVEFDSDVNEVHFSILDIDESDIMQITAQDASAADVSPTLSAGNASPSFVLFSDPGTNTFTATGNGVVNGVRDSFGTVNIEFSSPIKTFTITIGNSVDSRISSALTDIWFCDVSYGPGTLPNCDPGDGTEGVILASAGKQTGTSTPQNEVHIINVETGVTNILFDENDTDISPIPLVNGINSLAVDEVNSRVYFVHERTGTATDRTLYVYEGATGKYRELVADVTLAPLNIELGQYGLGSAAATFYDGYLFLAIEDVQYPIASTFFPYTFARDHVYRIAFDATGEPVEAKRIWTGFSQYGDITVRDGVVYTTSLHSTVINFDLISGGTERVSIDSDIKLGQSSLTHDGSIWSVWDSLVEYDPATKQLVGPEIPLTGDWDATNAGDATACVNPLSTLPVSVNSFRSVAVEDQLVVNWATASETFTAGFKLWSIDNGNWQRLNSKIIPASASESFEGSTYRQRLSLGAMANTVDYVGLSSVDTNGREHFYGPFEVGKPYGRTTGARRIPWKTVGNEHSSWFNSRGYVRFKRAWRRQQRRIEARVSAREAVSLKDAVTLYTEEHGMHRLTWADLSAAGVDLNGIAPSDIAITYLGKPVSRYVGNAVNGFGPDSYIDFYAQPLPMAERAHTSVNAYQLRTDPALARHAPSNAVGDDAVDTHYRRTLRIENNREYSFTSPDADPWYDVRILSMGSPASHSLDLDLADLVAGEDALLEVDLSGITDWPGSDPDHHVRLYLNDTRIADERRDGVTAWKFSVPVAAAVMKPGTNTLRIEVVGDTGFSFDVVHLERVAIHYPRAKVMTHGRFEFADNAWVHGITGAAAGAVAYAHAGNDLVRLPVLQRDGSALISGAALPGGRYTVAMPSQLLKPQIGVRPASDDLTATPADYLIISHPMFIDGLDAYVSAKTAEGLSVSVIDVQDIYATWGFGVESPQAIRAFLKAASTQFSYTHVLLVGAASSDPADFSGSGSVNLMPTLYQSTSLISHTPSDGALVDFDGDDRPDKAIGRWPVRTGAELAAVISKSLDYTNNAASLESLLMITDFVEPGVDFQAQAGRIADVFVDNAPASQSWTTRTDVFLNDYSGSSSDAVSQAQSDLIDTINAGVAMTVYAGHGSPSAWSYQNLVTNATVDSLTNTSTPTMMMPLACYTTYFVSPASDTLGQSLLVKPAGAAAVHGATTLSYFHHNEAMAKAIIEGLLRDGLSIGEAIRQAKSTLGTQYRDVIINWVLLGDPTLSL